MLTRFGEDIWLADGGEVVAALGFHYPLRMVVIRLDDGGLFLWSPVPLDAALRDAVAELGPVSFIVAPNGLHHLSVPDWAAAFPGAEVWGAPGLAQKCPGIAFDGTLGDMPAPGWAGQIDQVLLTNRITDEVVFFHARSGTAIFTDLLQELPRGWFTGWRALVARLDKLVGPGPNVPRKFRVGFSDKAASRAALRRVLDWPVRRLVMAHGTPVSTNARAALERAFAWLNP